MKLLDFIQIAFYVILALLAIWVAAQAVSTMRGISQDLAQGRLMYAELLRQSQQALKDHEAMFAEHQDQMRLLRQR